MSKMESDSTASAARMDGHISEIRNVSEEDLIHTNTTTDPQTHSTILHAPFYHNLVILPPLQQSHSNSTNTSRPQVIQDAILLPPIQATEPVASIRTALMDIRGYAHMTQYTLVLEQDAQLIQDILVIQQQQHQPKEKQESTSSFTNTNTEDARNNTSSKNNNGHGKKKKNTNKNHNSSSGGNMQMNLPDPPPPIHHHPSTTTMNWQDIPYTLVGSPYTLDTAVIQTATSWTGLLEETTHQTTEDTKQESTVDTVVTLNDFEDLTGLASRGYIQSNTTCFRMILQRYDLGSVKDHVDRLKLLLDGNIPTMTQLYHGGSSSTSTSTSSKTVESETMEKVVETEEEKVDVQSSSTEEKTTLTTTGVSSPDIQLPPLSVDQPVAISGKDLAHFFYLAFGEQEWIDFVSSTSSSRNVKDSSQDNIMGSYSQQVQKRLQLEAACKIPCTITYGGFNPPLPHRRLLGDIAYLDVSLPQQIKMVEGMGSTMVYVTATVYGFYINRTTTTSSESNNQQSFKKHGPNREFILDPRPADEPCFSHTLLDCLLLYSKPLRLYWARALSAATERSSLLAEMSSQENAFQGLFRSVIRADFYDPKSIGPLKLVPDSLRGEHVVDSIFVRPSWIVPGIRSTITDYRGMEEQTYHLGRSSDYFNNTYGIDFRNSPLRDWNEEVQSARDMSRETLQDRMDRAKVIHKVLSDFADASVTGTMAIFDGHLTPMNPNEPTRSHVYLHNNIFFSRAVDSGLDTFKVAQGDLCARKIANRDVQCVQTLHQLDVQGINTLATVLVDYLGTRLVCQSIVPGILYGEKNHTIVYGAVEASSPIAWNQEFHQKLEDNLGKVMRIASRPLPLYPLSADRMGNADNPPNSNVMICGPVEMKGIRGSDHRTYCLDITRLTPRDANWVPQAEGGTGQWEGLMTSPKFTKTQKTFIPSSLSDDEWLAAVLRPELLQKFQEKKTRQNTENESATSAQPDTDRTPRVADDSVPTNAIVDDSSPINKGKEQEQTNFEDSNIVCEMNLNVFIPRLCIPCDDVPGLSSQWKKDEDIVREASNYLWDDVLPELTSDIRKNQNIQIPMDGRSLTQFIHEKGINCRYLGRLATLALHEETKDKLEATEVHLGHKTSIERLRMPLCWLELLECEMVARCSKHVLDRYLSESFSVTGVQPLVLVASVLSAIMSTSEEGAADTDNRLHRQLKTTSETGIPTTLFFGENDKNNRDILVRGRNEIWDDINHEIGSRFRYTLTLYNSKIEAMRSRALMIPLLRRVCQRMGIRLAAKNYQVGDKCFCGGSLNAVLMNTSLIFPIAPIDIVNISPMIKHAGFQDGHSFVPYIPGSGVVSSCLHILLPDAKSALDSSQVHLQSKALPTALEVVQEASTMYQKVVESPLHVNIASCLETTAIILFEAQEFELACVTAIKALALLAQVCGVDSHEVAAMHVTTFHIFYSVGEYAKCVQHLRAAIYLMELQCGPHSVEMANLYQRLGVLYYEKGQLLTALRLYQEATTRSCRDLVLEGVMVKTCANILANLNIFKAALEMEKRAYTLFTRTLGTEHELTKTSAAALEHFMAMAVAQGNRQSEEIKRRIETEAADSIANQIKADLDAEENIRKNGGESKKKNKKKKSNRNKQVKV